LPVPPVTTLWSNEVTRAAVFSVRTGRPIGRLLSTMRPASLRTIEIARGRLPNAEPSIRLPR